MIRKRARKVRKACKARSERKVNVRGQEILNNPFLNKGTAFSEEERRKFNLVGLLPPRIQTIDEQATQTYAQYEAKTSNLEKRRFLMEIFNTNRTLFYYLFSKHIAEFNPIVYDPVIAESIENYSELFVETQYATYLDINHPQDIRVTLENAAAGRDIRLIVVTDAEGILGIGDWGTQGVDISIGKLMIYTAAAGIDPATVLPIVIDAGTDREELLNNPLYLGNRQKRVRGEAYDSFIDSFVNEAYSLFPQLYLHWEDFGRENAARILDRYKTKIPTFNDGIQGTGIITLAGLFGAFKITGKHLVNQRYLCYGGGTAGAGIAHRVLLEMMQEGLTEEEAYQRFYMVDKQGLLFDDMTDLTPEQKPFARKRSEFVGSDADPEFAGLDFTKLEDVVRAVKPTILVGTSTQPHTFTQEIVELMCSYTERPMIFPLSNPTKLAEATAQDLIEWSHGKALVATGIPYDDFEYNGVTYSIGQANNALIYPSLGLGVMASHAKLLTDEMISAAAHSLTDIADYSQPGAAVLPPVSRLADFSFNVALAVAETAKKQGIAKVETDDMEAAICQIQWTPEYSEYRELDI